MIRRIALAVLHAAPLVIFLLMCIWMGVTLTAYKTSVLGQVTAVDLAGFSVRYADAHLFNWHPVLMTFGLLFCSYEAALVFVTAPFDHNTNKIVHASLHGMSLLSAVLGAIAVFSYHFAQKIPNLYSLHSWLGLLTVVAFLEQVVVGFVAFLYPRLAARWRLALVPYHVGFGVAVLGLVAATIVTGIMEKLGFNGSCNISGKLDGRDVHGYMAPDCMLGNVIGLLVALTFGSVAMTVIVSKLPTPPRGPIELAMDGTETVPLMAHDD
ncbi:hypothetical protein SPRG_08752 [Saprolegnia parasitica CBS 223.65]|uniref:Cytochrome b561 domain-containing protein n=1 Tax=Saprolegnia parasitica (strain CBS 223.65) TaxID=695850 RepID=A0A067C4W3_SAPPC|nr:hypothetical protein SPRG_08752 [Saprolegnia parasitica CBS 223.65]KDO25809.1 hypothetical protein SPRG_08752 [Saprolegnia parasitica CBS 223.65]|eukprot:XP_012203374.1 hypothetical protein SPRG_08752 [Saprolegnia parasitica CBS 223.65]